MAKRKPLEKSDAPASLQPKAELPEIESPSISPAEPARQTDAAPIVEAAAAPAAAADLKLAAKPGFAMPILNMPILNMPSFKLSLRQKRNALLAASVVFAALVGAVAGAVGTNAGRAAKTPAANAAGLEDRQAMQQSIAHLSKEVASLKVSLDVANKSAGSEMKKIADRLAAAVADVTGSVTPPQSVPATETQAATPLPPPRPAPQEVAALEPPALPRLAVVPDWSIRFARDGMALVQGHGETYQAVLGAPLPGLGPVQTIKREDGRWMVVTPRGIIVSARDRHYFE